MTAGYTGDRVVNHRSRVQDRRIEDALEAHAHAY